MQPVYTPVSFLKRFLIGQEQQMTVLDLMIQLKGCESFFLSAYNMHAKDLIEHIIGQEDSPFIIDTTDTIQLEEFPIKINNIAYEYLVQTGKPQSLERLIKQVSKRTKIPIEQVQKQLYIDKDIRFVQIYGFDRWFLTEWEICNDEIYELLLERDSRETTIQHIFQLISTRIQEKDGPRKIWIPDFDSRFIVLDNGKVTIEENHEEECIMDCKQSENTIHQKNITNVIEKTTVEEKISEDTCQSVIRQLYDGINILEERNKRMSEEVIGHFNNNNIEAIHKLMEEKRINLELQQDISKIIEKWTK